MEFKPTFFSIAGFLVPGIVLEALLVTLAVGHYIGSAELALAGLPKLANENGWALLVGSAVAFTVLAFAFIVGTILSDLFILVGRRLILRPLLRKSIRENVDRVFKHQTLDALVRADMNARESYVYMHTCGVDLHWYAGRVRMMGSTGLACLVASIYALALCYGKGVWLTLGLIGVLAIAIALYRSAKFDQYVSGVSAVLLRGGGSDASKSET